MLLLACALLAAASSGQTEYLRSPGYKAYLQANALFAGGNFNGSREAADQALQLDPDLFPALTLRARLAMAVKDHESARKVLLRAVKVAPGSWQAHFLLGFQYYLESNLQSAIPALEKARALRPDESPPALYLGLTHESLGNNAKALELYRQAIAVEDRAGRLQAETLLTAARLLLLLNRLEESSALIQRALRLQPDLRDVHYESARLCLKRGDSAAAALAGEKALALAAGAVTDQQIRYLLVRAYRLLGDDRRATAHADALRNSSP